MWRKGLSYLHAECRCLWRPKEAVGSTGAGVKGSFEPCNVGLGTKFTTSIRASHAVNTESFLQPNTSPLKDFTMSQ